MRRVALLLMLALVTACGNAGPGDPGSTAEGTNDAYLKYAQCLRKHGVEGFPDDPKKLPGGVEIPEKAGKACAAEMEGVGKTVDTRDPAYLDRMTRLAACMRGQGIDFPDPGPAGAVPDPGYDGGDKEAFDAAMRTCSAQLEGQ
ncbi:hypothetical protein OUY22_02785 [Nonomuraea sp. MCN248]|uniref:Lipoprotein n=1 Tax=Nonomuraea corallina TaxID=2989783 RepID=A0ABT4S550_9ACTN|nr:hypothetical protein [Nonomuraea corallina]MDA0632326.1 hypothetical protein [Nonomuraea corallina]